MEVCVVRGTPPSTPLRRNMRRFQRESPRNSNTRRRSLFREESDLSDISPLSPSSEDKTPKKKTPKKGGSTPLRGLKDICLDSPVVRVHSEGFRVRGVTALNREEVGSIPPNLFYGSHTEPRPPPTWIRKEASKAKTKLFLDDLPRDRKRARTSSGQKIQPSAKRLRKSLPGHSPRTPLTPIPMLGQNRSTGKIKKKSPPQKSKEPTKSPGFKEGNETVNDENIDFNQTKDFVTTEKDVEDIVGQEIIRRAKKRDTEKEKDKMSMIGNWEVSFTKESRLNECSTPSTDPTRKFFKNHVSTTPKMVRRASSALTPPWSSHKMKNPHRRKTLCKPNYVFSPNKASPRKNSQTNTPQRRSPRKSPNKQKQLDGLIMSISKDICEMMEDDPSVEAKDEVTKLIQQLNQNDVTNDWASALPSPEEDEMIEDEEPKTPTKNTTNRSPIKSIGENGMNEEDSKLFPIFRSDKKAMPMCSPSKSPSKSKKKSKKYFGFGEDQYQIDSGQNNLREIQCKECGLFYSMGCPEDEIIHKKHHSNSSILTYNGWKKERVVGTNGDGKIISILKDDPKSWWNKAKEVVEMVDTILGFPQVSIDSLRHPQIYLYIKDNKEIAGCLVAEQVTSGFKLLSLEQDVDLCSEESFPAKCGVSRIWVSSKYRRSSIATSLINMLRASFAYGVILRKEDLAFTVPTDDGKRFISKYMGQNTGYLVYM